MYCLQEYIDHINEIVRWLGWAPFKVSTGHVLALNESPPS